MNFSFIYPEETGLDRHTDGQHSGPISVLFFPFEARIRKKRIFNNKQKKIKKKIHLLTTLKTYKKLIK